MKPSSNQKGGWKESDMTESGTFVHGWLTGKTPLKPEPAGCCVTEGTDCNKIPGYCDYSISNCEKTDICKGTWKPY